MQNKLESHDGDTPQNPSALAKPVVLFIVNDAWFFVSHRLPIAKQSIEQGYEVHVLAKRDATVKEIEASGCQFHDWDLAPRGRSIWKETVSFITVIRKMKNITPNIVHLVTIKSVLYGGFAARLNRIPRVIVAVAGMGALFNSNRTSIKLLQPIIKWAYKNATHHRYITYIFQNHDDKTTFQKLFNIAESSTRLFHGSGVDLKKIIYKPNNETTPNVVMGARLIKEKGVFEFIEAARLVKREFPQVRFILAGGTLAEGNPGAVSLEQLNAANSDAAVEVLGHVDDMAALLSEATVVALPSYYNEGLPKFLAEAAAAGKPVVTTDHPGCRDAIEANKTGLLVPIRSADALANAITELLKHPDKRESMGKLARERATKLFDIDLIVGRHLQLYEELLQQPD